MTHARRFAAIAAIAFFAILNTGTSQSTDSTDPVPAEPAEQAEMPTGTVDRFCHRPNEGRCQSMRLSAGYEDEAEQLRCQQVNGVWDQTPCDTTNIVGRCVAQDQRSAWYFSPPQWTEPSAHELCNTMTTMTWMPGMN